MWCLNRTAITETIKVSHLSDHTYLLLFQEAQADLDQVLPELRAAEEGLYSIKKADLVEIR